MASVLGIAKPETYPHSETLKNGDGKLEIWKNVR